MWRALLPALIAVASATEISFLVAGDWIHSESDQLTEKEQRTSRGILMTSRMERSEDAFILTPNLNPAQAAALDFNAMITKEVFTLPNEVVAGLSGADGRKVSRSWVCGGSDFIPATCHLDVVLINTPLLIAGTNSSDEKKRDLAERHLTWIECQLRTSTADFLLVAGQHSIYGVGKEGSNQVLISTVFPLLQNHGASYLSGSDNNMASLIVRGVTMISVGGMECCDFKQAPLPPPVATAIFPDTKTSQLVEYFAEQFSDKPITGGFSNIKCGFSSCIVSFYAQDGRLLNTERIRIRDVAGTAFHNGCRFKPQDDRVAWHV